MAVEAATVSTREGPALANAVAAGLVAAPLLVRRSFPVAAGVLGWGAASVMTALLTPATEISSLVVPVVLYPYAAGAHAGTRGAWAGLAVGVGGILALDVLQGGPTWGDVVFPAILVGLSWLAGRAVRSQTAMAREVVERAQMLERASEDAAIATAAQERRRIARELHDIVAQPMRRRCDRRADRAPACPDRRRPGARAHRLAVDPRGRGRHRGRRRGAGR